MPDKKTIEALKLMDSLFGGLPSDINKPAEIETVKDSPELPEIISNTLQGDEPKITEIK